MESLNIKGLPRMATSSKGIAFFDALEMCKLFKIDISDKKFVLDRWNQALKLMPFDPEHREHEAPEGSLWIPLVMMVTFVESLGLKRAQFEQVQEWPPASLEYGLVQRVVDDQFVMARRALAQANS